MDILEEGNGAPFSIICRTCLKAKQGMDSVYSSTIPDMLMYCVSLKVEHGDGLPNLICSQCIKQINQLFSFKRLCEKSESLLKHYLPLKIIPAQDLTTEDVTQNQILDTLEDPTLTSTSCHDMSNDPLVEPLDEKDRLVETEDLIPLSHYDGSSLFGPDVDLDSEQSLYPIQVNDFMSNFFDVTDNSLADSTADTSTPSFKDMDLMIEDSTTGTVSCYQCPECKESLTCSEDLSIHMSIHVEGSLQCNVCKKIFHKKDSLKRHIKRHMKNKPMCCKLCNKRFSDKSDLRKHLKRHKTGTEKSDVSHSNYVNFSNTDNSNEQICLEHKPLVHESQFVNICPRNKCEQVFNNEVTLFDHLNRNHNFICHESGNGPNKLAQVSNLQRVQPGFPHSEQRFSCTLCSGHSYKRISSLKDHICRVHPQTGQTQKFDESFVYKTQHKSLLFKCHVCNKSFPQKYRRKRHMLCHLRKGEIKEVNGNYMFDLNNQDELSQQSHVDQTTLCTLDFMKEPDADLIDTVVDPVAEDLQLTKIGSFFTKDLNSKDDEENYNCKICKTKLMDPKDLKAHMSLHPINISVWQCNICQKCFSKKTFLSRHIKIHMTRDMFPCEHCNKRFYEKSKLKKHITKVHSRENEQFFNNEEKNNHKHKDKLTTNSLSQSLLVKNSVSYSLDTTNDYSHSLANQTKIISNPIVFPISSESELHIEESKDVPQYFLEKYQDKENSYLKIGIESISNIEPSTNGSHVNDISQSTIDSPYSLTCSQNIHKLNSKIDSVQIDDSLKPEPNYFCCEVCGKQFEKAIKLYLHMRSHNQSQVPDANSTFQLSKKSLVDSIKTEEPETNSISQISDEVFDTLKYDLHLHSKVEHDVSEKAPPTCKICNMSFPSIYKRRKHMQTHKILSTNTNISV